MFDLTDSLTLFAAGCSQDPIRSNYEKDFNTLLISTTNKCPLQCAHCCVNASLDAGVGIDSNLLKEKLDEFYRHQSDTSIFRNIVLTGGEPFLRRDIINCIAEISKLFELSFGIVTGCFWGKNNTSTFLDLLEMIADSNGYLCISIDKFHLEEIGTETYLAALDICQRVHMPIRIFYAYDPDMIDEEMQIQDFILNLLLKHQNIVSVWPQPIRKTGRFSKSKEFDEPIKSPCHLVNAPNIDIDGSYYPCCGDWHDSHMWRQASKKKLALGNLAANTLSELVNAHRKSLFINAVKHAGPWTLAKQYQSKENKTCKGLCELCEFSISFMETPHTSLK